VVRERQIKVGETAVTGRVYAPVNDHGVTLVLGHGAGADQRHRFMVRHAEALAARGLRVVTFNFVYSEQKRRAPDRNDALERCFRAVVEDVRQPGRPLAVGGKSMGGRIASQVVAGGLDRVCALVFLGYPLHPPGKPETLRSAHLSKIEAPMLFVQGERDTFGSPDELSPILQGLPHAQLMGIAGADHSLEVGKKADQSAVDAQIDDRIAAFVLNAAGKPAGR
jgi:predicted alpha/beta-hydrolase family hydrolase